MLLRNALIADSETTRLRRGAGLHEFSIFDVQKRQVKEFIVNPNAVHVTPLIPQDVTGLASSSRDIHTRLGVTSWQQTIAHEVLEATGVHGNAQAQMEALRWSNPFLHSSLVAQQYPHLHGLTENNAERIQRFSRFGISVDLGNKTSVEELVRQHIPAALTPEKGTQGTTLWAANASFECLAGGTLIQSTDGSIIEIDKITTQLNIFGTESVDSSFRTVVSVEAKPVVSKGVKHCYRVKPVYGIPTVASDKHLWFTQRGWLFTEDLTENDWLLSNAHEFDLPEANFTDAELQLIGWYIAEGRRLTRTESCVNITVTEQEYIDQLPQFEELKWKTNNGKDYRIVSDTPGKKNPCIDLIRKVGLSNKYSYEKYLTDDLLKISNRQLRIILQCMYSGDGHVSEHAIVYTTTSKKLADRLSLVLQRFGILSSYVVIEDNRKGSYKTCYRIVISNEFLIPFYEKIGFLGRKQKELATEIESWKNRGQRIDCRRVPLEITPNWKPRWQLFVDDLKLPKKGNPPWKKYLREFTQTNTDGVYDGNSRSWSFKAFRALERILNVRHPEGLFWTPISSIVDVGECEVFDIETNTHEFLANGLLVHNSKQIGSQIAAQRALGETIDWKSMLETHNQISPDPFHVTGREVNQARVAAQITGDWRGVYKAYKQFVPKGGEVAVRDIQDVTRSMMSYAREAKLFTGGSSYLGTSIDISHRIAAIVKNDPLHMALVETHRAAEDSAIHEDFVLKTHVEWTEALQQSEEKTPLGMLYRKQAEAGVGPLAEVAKASSLLEQIAPQLNRKNLLQRLGRAHEDLMTTGETYQSTGVEGFYHMTQNTPGGGEISVPRAQHAMQRFTNMDELSAYLAANERYGDFGIDIGAETRTFLQNANTRQAGAEYVEREIASTMESINWQKMTPSIRKLSMMDRGMGAVGQAASEAFEHIRGKPSSLLLGAGALTAAGAAWSLVQAKPKDQTSLLGFGYEEWLSAQEGMASQGLAKELRARNTDFGSPYRGPIISSEVFNDQKMLAEREKWLRAQYGATMYDAENGLFGTFSVFNQRRGHQYISEGTKVANGYQGLRGNNLVSLNLDDGWKLSVEDADTISVKRGGIRGAISSFFGLNNGYSFRLAGIDSEEISHRGNAAQPYGDQARLALQAMMDNSKTHEIVFDPTNITYGRMMGGLIADNRNLNIEMVKQGVAAALPFGSQKDAMVDYQDIIKANDRAVEAQRGMWGQPWGQAIAAMASAKQRPTFNTLADTSKVVANSGQMSLLAIANASQERGSFEPYRNQAANVHLDTHPDDVGAHYYTTNMSPSKMYMNELLTDTRNHMKEHGNYGSAGVSARGGYGHYDKYLSLDSMGTTNSVWTKRRYAVFDQYETDKVRNKQRQLQMAALQQRQSAMMFQSPINHARM